MINHPDIKKKRLSSYSYIETRTANDQLLEVRCPTEYVDKVKEVLALTVSIQPAINHTTNVTHGGYGRYSRFKLDQKKYAGGHGGYIEVLRILDAPDNRCPNVLHSMSVYHGSSFTEFKTIKDAVDAWNKYYGKLFERESLEEIPGFIRHVKCGVLDPWFYALGDQHITGDFVFPDVFNEHPQYRVGTKFIVDDKADGCRKVKMCMGAVTREKDSGNYWGCTGNKYRETEIFWDDGTSSLATNNVRILQDNKLWIDEAITKFKRLISGTCTHFEIPFVDGSKFLGRLKLCDGTSKSEPGIYVITVVVKDKNGERTVTGRQSFTPTDDCKTIYDRVKLDAEIKGIELVRFESCVKENKRNESAKWKGVFELEKVEKNI